MDRQAVARGPRTFNGPLEAGIRAVVLLRAAYPRSFDLQRVLGFDYLLVHTADIGGPESLHPPSPLHASQMLIRRSLVERGILLMMTRHLIEREATPRGIRYRAGEAAASFLDALQSPYTQELKKRARWTVMRLGDSTDEQFREVMRRFFDAWVEEFQSAERALGVDL